MSNDHEKSGISSSIVLIHRGHQLAATNWWSDHPGKHVTVLCYSNNRFFLLLSSKDEAAFLAKKRESVYFVVLRVSEAGINHGEVVILIGAGREVFVTFRLKRDQVLNPPRGKGFPPHFVVDVYIDRFGPKRVCGGAASMFDVDELPFGEPPYGASVP